MKPGQRMRIACYGDKDLTLLSPKEAGSRIMNDPDSVCVTIPEIMRVFHLSEPELRAELVAGRLVAVGNKTDEGWTNVCVTMTHLIEWVALTGREISSIN